MYLLDFHDPLVCIKFIFQMRQNKLISQSAHNKTTNNTGFYSNYVILELAHTKYTDHRPVEIPLGCSMVDLAWVGTHLKLDFQASNGQRARLVYNSFADGLA